jgi:hypothetical protein
MEREAASKAASARTSQNIANANYDFFSDCYATQLAGPQPAADSHTCCLM